MEKSKWLKVESDVFHAYTEAVVTAMREKGVTQVMLAEKMGVSQPLVSRWLCGHLRNNERISGDNWERLCAGGMFVGVVAPMLDVWHPRSALQSVAQNVPAHGAPKRNGSWSSSETAKLRVLELVKSGELTPEGAVKLLSSL